jgi:hypothetical protein
VNFVENWGTKPGLKEGNEHSTRMGSKRKETPKQDCVRKHAREKWNLSELRRGRNELVISASQETAQPSSSSPHEPISKINHVFVEKNLTLWQMN